MVITAASVLDRAHQEQGVAPESVRADTSVLVAAAQHAAGGDPLT